jgi:hypothetical protein
LTNGRRWRFILERICPFRRSLRPYLSVGTLASSMTHLVQAQFDERKVHPTAPIWTDRW